MSSTDRLEGMTQAVMERIEPWLGEGANAPDIRYAIERAISSAMTIGTDPLPQPDQFSYAGRAPFIEETGKGPLGADSKDGWMVAMLRHTAESLMSDAKHDAARGHLDKYRIGQLSQIRLNLLSVADLISRLQPTTQAADAVAEGLNGSHAV